MLALQISRLAPSCEARLIRTRWAMTKVISFYILCNVLGVIESKSNTRRVGEHSRRLRRDRGGIRTRGDASEPRPGGGRDAYRVSGAGSRRRNMHKRRLHADQDDGGERGRGVSGAARRRLWSQDGAGERRSEAGTAAKAGDRGQFSECQSGSD